jgi:transposase
MIQITPQMRLLVAVEPVDFRLGIDGLARRCRELGCDPFSGVLVVFRNRRATAIKVLNFDGQGFWMCHKRLSAGRFGYWPELGGQALRTLDALQLSALLWNGPWTQVAGGAVWRGVTPAC